MHKNDGELNCWNGFNAKQIENCSTQSQVSTNGLSNSICSHIIHSSNYSLVDKWYNIDKYDTKAANHLEWRWQLSEQLTMTAATTVQIRCNEETKWLNGPALLPEALCSNCEHFIWIIITWIDRHWHWHSSSPIHASTIVNKSWPLQVFHTCIQLLSGKKNDV